MSVCVCVCVTFAYACIYVHTNFQILYTYDAVLGVALMLGGKIFWLVKNASLREDQKSFVARHGPGA